MTMDDLVQVTRSCNSDPLEHAIKVINNMILQRDNCHDNYNNLAREMNDIQAKYIRVLERRVQDHVSSQVD
jgi:hypothetical protein